MARSNVFVTGAVLAICGAAAAWGGGCAPGEPLKLIKDQAQFQTDVLEARKPTMVLFYKEGCPACAALEPTLEQLTLEYHGRVAFAKFAMISFFFVPYAVELEKKYTLRLYPTVVLFVNGQDNYPHLVGEYSIEPYRKLLNQVTASKSATQRAAAE